MEEEFSEIELNDEDPNAGDLIIGGTGYFGALSVGIAYTNGAIVGGTFTGASLGQCTLNIDNLKSFVNGDAVISRNLIVGGSACISGNLTVGGNLSKGSGTFDIAHPLLEEKKLRHSFVEGPRYDNIYRNKIRLSNGKASVNLDTDCVSPGGQTMTPGTWEKLNRNPDIFLQNLEGWSRLRGKIESSILEIECEDENSTDLISWMVVAERQDDFVINSKLSDDEGRLILEYET